MKAIVEREIDLISEDATIPIRLKLGRPTLESPDGPWVCSFRVEGPGIDAGHGIFGEDGLQALKLALRMADEHIRAYAASRGMTACWLDKKIPPVFDELEVLDRTQQSLSNVVVALQAAQEALTDPTATLASRAELARKLQPVVDTWGMVDLQTKPKAGDA